MATKTQRTQLDQNEWINAALDLLVSHGIDDVRVEPLAKKLGVTKGSFYWHFKDRAALLQALLEKWKEKATSAIIDQLEQAGTSAADKLWRALEIKAAPRSIESTAVELAIRSWALHDDIAAAAVMEADRLRLNYGTTAFQELGFSEEDAKACSFLYLAFNIGESLILNSETVNERAELRANCADLLGFGT